jgi:hypothetical protein
MSRLHTLHAAPHAHPGMPLPGVNGRWAWPNLLPIGRSATELWWLNPLACAAILLAVYSTFMGFDFLRVVPIAYIPGLHYAWGAALLVTMAIGMLLVMAAREPDPSSDGAVAIDVPPWAMASLMIGTLIAYAVWFAPLATDPRLVLDILSGERSSVRGVVTTTPGLTTMTQFGMAYAIAFAAMRSSRVRQLERWERAGLALVVVLAVIRSVVWSERLAVIELVVVYVVARLAFARVTTQRRWRVGTFVPLLAPLLLYVVFTGTEYIRSWDYYRGDYNSVWAFSFERLLTYYATASNNGIGLLVENQDWPLFSGRFVAEWLYLMPALGDWMRESLGDPMNYYNTFLDRFARPEFNSATGLFQVVFDLGYAGSMLYFLAVGALIGRLWDGWRRQSAFGVLFYPVAVMFLVELLRFNYFAATRFFPLALALSFLWMAARRVPVQPLPTRPAWST